MTANPGGGDYRPPCYWFLGAHAGNCHSVAQDATDAPETPARTPGGSEGAEARTEALGGGHPTHIERRIVCAECGQLLGGFHKGCDGMWIEQRRVVQEWWS